MDLPLPLAAARWRRAFLFLAALALVVGSELGAATAVLAPAKDTTLYGNGDAHLSNGAGSGLFVGRSGGIGRTLRTLIAFNVAGQIPAGATINSVVLTFTVTTPKNHPGAVQVRRLLADWGEGVATASGGGGGGAPATTGSATWLARFFNTAAWSAPGGDFVATVSATQSVSGTSGTVSFASAALAADVQGWLDQPAANFGWLLRAENETVAAVRFSSREGAAPPTLTITYTPVVARHSADCLPADGRLSLLELGRVIDLYNTRRNSERTGCYRVQDGTEDGFAAEPLRSAAEAVTLSRYHSADSAARGPRDGRIDLPEMLRVIELYNYRAGSLRTGEYRAATGTEDGFAPGPGP